MKQNVKKSDRFQNLDLIFYFSIDNPFKGQSIQTRTECVYHIEIFQEKHNQP